MDPVFIRLPVSASYPVQIIEVHVEKGVNLQKGDLIYTIKDANSVIGHMKSPFDALVEDQPVAVGAAFSNSIPVLNIKPLKNLSKKDEKEISNEISLDEIFYSKLNNSIQFVATKSLSDYRFWLGNELLHSGFTKSEANKYIFDRRLDQFWREQNFKLMNQRFEEMLSSSISISSAKQPILSDLKRHLKNKMLTIIKSNDLIDEFFEEESVNKKISDFFNQNTVNENHKKTNGRLGILFFTVFLLVISSLTILLRLNGLDLFINDLSEKYDLHETFFKIIFSAIISLFLVFLWLGSGMSNLAKVGLVILVSVLTLPAYLISTEKLDFLEFKQILSAEQKTELSNSSDGDQFNEEENVLQH